MNNWNPLPSFERDIFKGHRQAVIPRPPYLSINQTRSDG